MSIIMAMMLETEGVGYVHSGTAIGIVFTLQQVGNVTLPPLGNSFASEAHPGTPFFFWASASVLALITLILTKETGSKGALNNIAP